MVDRVGIGWRPQLAAGILANLDRVDVVEVIAEDAFGSTRAMATLARQLPLYLHGVSLGLASSQPVEEWRLARMARLVDAIRPVAWSEHLAFVRAGGVEIGHLAAPPRNRATLDGTLANLERAWKRVGSLPLVENVASLIDPPGSTFDEGEWVARVVADSGAPLLLDLHNVYANAINFGFDAHGFLQRIDLGRVAMIHLAGGRFVDGSDGRARLVDDHLHEVPQAVFALLAEVAERAPGPLTVVVERDGRYPPIETLLAELDEARRALAQGRARRGDPQGARL